MLTFDNTQFDLGDVNFGDTKQQNVLVTNNTSEAIVIHSTGSSCSCTSGRMDSNPIEAYKSGKFQIFFNTTKTGRGLQVKSITLTWMEGGQTRNQTITFKVNVIN